MRQAGQQTGFWWRAWRGLALVIGLMLTASVAGRGHAAVPGMPIAESDLATQAAQFGEPLVPTAETSPEEDAALAAAIARYRSAPAVDDFSALEAFLTSHPQSGWRLAVETNLGLSYYHYGYFSKAIDAFDRAWTDGQPATQTYAKALADRAAGELLRMHARLGHVEQLAALLDKLETRGLSGPATEARDGAEETLWLMRNDPGRAFRCGPTALKALLRAAGVPEAKTRFLDRYRPGPQGTTLAELGRLATQVGFAHQLVYRGADQPVPVPSIVHWTTSHFATLLSERGGRYEVADPAAGRDHLWVTRAALDAETSGFFLVPGATAAAPWRRASAEEAAAIRGSGGPTGGSDDSHDTTNDQTAGGNSTCGGMCGYTFTEMMVSLRLADTPVGYIPPIGPAARVTLTYNQRDAGQPASFSFFNISPRWSLNWLSYIQDDPTGLGVSVTRIAAGGGSVGYPYNTTSNSFTPEVDTGAILSIVNPSFNPNVPRVYQRLLPDGTVETYSVSNKATSFPRYTFLSSITDPDGNSVTLNYDGKFRLLSLVDATGRTTKFTYGNSNPLLVTAISDPFGRTAKLSYDSSGRLQQITDVLGLTSAFSYDASSLINGLTTPYGTTSFTYGGTTGGEYSRYLQATDPLGQTERLELNQSAPGIAGSDPASTVPTGLPGAYNGELTYYSTFYWDKHAYAIGHGNYTQARMKHWTDAGGDTLTENTLGSIKFPLENRIWFSYPGQYSTNNPGTLNKPSGIGRVLDDGTTQLTQLQYNGLGNPTSLSDPVGRTTMLQYAPNQVDVTTIQQTTASGPATTAGFTYNGQHEPLTYTDAAGQTTHYSYNVAGQLTAITDPLGHATTFNYSPLGDLLSIINANGRTAASFTYDSFDRVATRTDSEGWTVGYLYDALDRVTQETYPDGTTRVYAYNKLDLKSVKDRQGRITTYAYDADRRLISIKDPLGQVTKLGYYENGALKTLTDPKGHVTTWAIDLQSRPVGKTYADGKTFVSTYEATTSRLHAVTDPLGQTKQYSYYADDRLGAIQYLHAVNATPSVGFSYDPSFPRLTAMVDGSGTTTYSYYAAGALGALRLAQETPPFANSAIAYQYDALGRVIARSVGGNVEAVGYDALGRVTAHADDLGTFQRLYLGQTGQLTQQRSGLVGTRWSYDTNLNDRRLTGIANSPVATRFGYVTTPEYDITAITESLQQQMWSYVYDNDDQLKSATSSLGPLYQYGYDAAGNLGAIQTPGGSTTVASNSVNQITTAGSAAFSYDADGNLLSDYARTYQWDADNRLIGIGYPGKPGSSSAFRYDGLGRRIAIVTTSGGVTGETHYAWCGQTMCQARTAADAPTRRYLAEGEEDLIDGALLYYGVDHLGSVRDVIAASTGLKSNHYDYDAYGNPTKSVGSRLTGTDFRYAGVFYHQQSGLYLATYRAYDPTVGRWLSRDPIEEAGGLNTYAYADGNPLSFTDPTGLDVEVCLYPDAANGAGHVGIGPPGGHTKGFYPVHLFPDPRSIHGPGIVHEDDEPHASCKTITSTPAQDTCAQRCEASRESNPGTYDLATRQCTSFVRDCLSQCGIPHGDYVGPWPKTFFNTIKPQ